MKVAAVEVSLLSVPLDRPYRIPMGDITHKWHVLAQVTTTDGVVGFGYDVVIQQALVRPIAAAARELSAHLVGMHVLELEAAWERLARAGRWVGPGGMLNFAIAPLDIAMWDAAGKTLGQPLYRLLGGYRDRVPAYASDGFWISFSHEQLAASARLAVDDGLSILKLRVGEEKEPAGELLRVAAIRDAVGSDMRILIEVAENWDVARALRTGRALQEAGVDWIEDPIDHANVAGLATIASRLDVPIATGEHLYEVGQFAQLFQKRAASIGLIDLGRIGGVTPWRRVAALAQAHDVRVCGHVLPEFHVHLLAAIPNGHLVEYQPSSAAILQAMPALEAGSMVAPKAPGFGLTLHEDALRRYRVEV
jgi:L-alanine-DL-glutamate epimerase-like enolase superfamily enzyme